MTSRRETEAIESSDTDDLLRIIDGHCSSVDWGALLSLRARCHEALSRGKQLWGVEEHIRYRLALESPAAIAGPIVGEGPARFAPGPLTEVAASTKAWNELSENLTPGPIRAAVAAERVIRGDVVEGEALELPGNLMSWEPTYPVATYKSDRVEAPSPGLPEMTAIQPDHGSEVIDDPASEGALADLVLPWTDESNGRAQTVSVMGGAGAALDALGAPLARVGTLTPQEALRWLAWAAASGGAHGRRRGGAAGRYLAWWAIASLGDLEWPADPEDVGRAATDLEWSWFDDGSPDTGWVLRIVATDPGEGLSWAISAADSD